MPRATSEEPGDDTSKDIPRARVANPVNSILTYKVYEDRDSSGLTDWGWGDKVTSRNRRC
jgi:hypothetical protein